jgi:hypothetical protein
MDEQSNPSASVDSVTTPTEIPVSSSETVASDTVASEQPAKRSLFWFGLAAVLVTGIGFAYWHFMYTPGSDAVPATETGTTELSPEEASEPVATVNGVTITRGTLAENVTQMRERALQSGADVNDLVVKAQIEEQAYTITINNELLRQAATAAVERPSDEAVQAEIDILVAQNGGPEAFAALLKEVAIDEETLRVNIADNMHIENYLATKQTPVTVSDEEATAFYDSLGGAEAGLPPFADIKTEIIAELERQKQDAQIGVIIDELRAAATIENV